jgi:hypothetical protein
MIIGRKPIVTRDPAAPQRENPGFHLITVPNIPAARRAMAAFCESPGCPADAKMYLTPMKLGGETAIIAMVTRDAAWSALIHRHLCDQGLPAFAIIAGHGEKPGINFAVHDGATS